MAPKYPDRISSVSLSKVDVPMRDAFIISQGSVTTAKNLFVRVTTENGLVGYGEITPFPELGGADRKTTEQVAREVAQLIVGQKTGALQKISKIMLSEFSHAVSVRCGLELALLDIEAQHFGTALYELIGGEDPIILESDITIPILPLERCYELTEVWYSKGFRTLKVKVGKDLDEDIEKVFGIAKLHTDTKLLVDANQGYTLEQALKFHSKVQPILDRIIAFEQPVYKKAIKDLAKFQASVSVPVVADEAVTTIEELLQIIELKAAKWVNIKTMKAGFLEAINIARLAKRANLGLMMGGMIETRINVGGSLAIANALGGFQVLDLDPPLLMHDDPVDGGFHYDGPYMKLPETIGHGMKAWGIDLWTLTA